MKTSLIISTYNWPEALNLCLNSLLIQTRFPDEVIIADDGSTEETTRLIRAFAAKVPFPLTHIWQEDDGFRKTMILNKAIAKSNCEYIIQVDGDVILHPQFIRDHIKAAKKGRFVSGSRVMLNASLSKEIVSTQQITFSFLEKGISKKRINGLYMPFSGMFIYPLFVNSKSYKRTKGCNIAFWKENLININGYNEDIHGWGSEDTELAVRLFNSGICRNTIRWALIVYHIDHNENSKERLVVNRDYLTDAISSKKSWCANGLDKYLAKEHYQE
ncbi:MAG: glycosyltransferase family 2 protein [Bacteroidales bacterium]|jgi:glycosyltransferase involved in cell wall biosynthesis|nr:glycosyltransferase family 2 protein [Bacteroidales bacterium]